MASSHHQRDYEIVASDYVDEAQVPLSEKRTASPRRSLRRWASPLVLRLCFLLLAVMLILAVFAHMSQQPASYNPAPVAAAANAAAITGPENSTTPAAHTTTYAAQLADEATSSHSAETEVATPTHTPSPHKSKCRKRKEWRTLTSREQRDYIDASLCLRDLFPANKDLDSNYTAYDEFPWIDAHHGYTAWGTAAYLPWHRQFLHLYEKTLRWRCGYRGSLVYWDWTLDHEDFHRSPVFDPLTGFGGDGVLGGAVTAGATGRCVVDGPFAGIQAEFWNGETIPHCLSRGFRPLHSHGGDIRPESIEELLSAETFDNFVAMMESKVRDTIPVSIGGEFESSTASYDPLYFLHFAQLDRLWWLWQQRQPWSRVFAYAGKKEVDSFEPASLNDELSFGGLGKTVMVANVMNTENKELCYHY